MKTTKAPAVLDQTKLEHFYDFSDDVRGDIMLDVECAIYQIKGISRQSNITLDYMQLKDDCVYVDLNSSSGGKEFKKFLKGKNIHFLSSAAYISHSLIMRFSDLLNAFPKIDLTSDLYQECDIE